MPDDNMVVIAAVARKGGSGKSMLMKALGSAALAGGNTVRMIDTDPQGDMTLWSRRAKAAGMVPREASFTNALNSKELEEVIDKAAEDGINYVFIDTAGQGGGWADPVAMISDFLVTPVLATESDFEICAQTVEWFQGLHKRVPNPENLPPHRVVLTGFPSKASVRQQALLRSAHKQFPLVNSVVQHRVAYHEMDARGFLSELLESLKGSSNPLHKGHARQMQVALVEATEVLNDILGK